MDDRNKKMESVLEKYNSAFGIKNTSFSIYAIDVDPNRRQEIRLALAEKGIQSGVHYAPAHYYPFYRMAIPNRMPKTEEKCASTLSIPFNPSLEEADLDFIIQSIKDLS
jgi:dTDP-4-amino-4,6-dideoxygalactose transaminase